MNSFGIQLEIAKHNLETAQMAKELVEDSRKGKREKEMGEPFCLSNLIKNTKSSPTNPKEYFIYRPCYDT